MSLLILRGPQPVRKKFRGRQRCRGRLLARPPCLWECRGRRFRAATRIYPGHSLPVGLVARV